MYSPDFGLPSWEQFLIESFDLEHVAVAARSGAIGMVYDPKAAVGLHVEFDTGGAHLQLGGSSWGERRTGRVRSTTQTVGRSLAGRRGEMLAAIQDRRRDALESVFDTTYATLDDAWIAAFGEESIRSDHRTGLVHR